MSQKDPHDFNVDKKRGQPKVAALFFRQVVVRSAGTDLTTLLINDKQKDNTMNNNHYSTLTNIFPHLNFLLDVT